MEYLDLLLDQDDVKILDKKYKDEIYNSLVSQWTILEPDKSIIKKYIHQEQNNDSVNFKSWITAGIKASNKYNEYVQDQVYNENFYNMLMDLYNNGVMFDTKFNPEYIIEIKQNEIVFPICCVGKNRSQYLFYFLKNLQAHKKSFEVGYPSSADELTVITDHLQAHKKSTQNVLSSYLTPYKKDAFSSAISYTFNLINPDGIKEITRSVHIFDKILKTSSSYLLSDIKNFETLKYKINNHDLFDPINNEFDDKIKLLYIKYFLNPSNLIEISRTKIDRISYVCLSDKSFYNFCLCVGEVKKKYPKMNLNSIRIIYFGIQDIFQRSSIKNDILIKYKEKIVNSFQ